MLLIRAARPGNGGPSTLIIIIEDSEPLARRRLKILKKEFHDVDLALGFRGSVEKKDGGKVLKFTWDNRAPLTWTENNTDPTWPQRVLGFLSDRRERGFCCVS